MISEGIANVNAVGFALDAGVQYITGTRKDPDKVKFGLSLRNVGLPMRYRGDGLTFRGEEPNEGNYLMTLLQLSEKFELPSLLNIGASYDIQLDSAVHRLTIAGNFTSHSFYNDQIGLGVEYAFHEKFMARVGYQYEKDIFDALLSRTISKGLSTGITVELPLQKNGPKFAIDYSFRATRNFKGTHTFGLRMDL